MSKSITFEVDDDVLQKVQEIAAREKTTVDGMVGAFLREKAKEIKVPEQRRKAVERLLELSRNTQARLGQNWKFDREAVYAERLSRHQHPGVRGGRGSG